MLGIEDKFLVGASQGTIRSLNGTRVADAILQNIPNMVTFKIALRFIKYWIKRRGLYGNKLGYLGGVQSAILTARICQLYPCALASTIVSKLFKVLLIWAENQVWGPDNPIKLCDETSKKPPGAAEWELLDKQIWTPKRMS